MPSVLMEQAKTHLEFLGYTLSPIEGETEELRAKLPGRYGFSLTATEHILKFCTVFAIKKVEESQLLKFLNSLNLGSIIVSFCKNDHNTLVCQGVFYGGYNKPSFALFLEAWDHDMSTTLGGRFEELGKYIE